MRASKLFRLAGLLVALPLMPVVAFVSYLACVGETQKLPGLCRWLAAWWSAFRRSSTDD